MKFDIQGARRAGYSDDEIADFLSKERNFDLQAATQAGYSSSEILDFLTSEVGAGRGLINPPMASEPQPTMPAVETPEQRPSFLPESQEQGLPESARKFNKAARLKAKAEGTPSSFADEAKDFGLSFLQGTMDVASLPVTLYEQVSGNKDSAIRRFFRTGQEAAEELKSDKSKARREATAAAIDAAENWQEALAVGIVEGFSDPSATVQTLARMVPQIAAGGGAGRLVEAGVTGLTNAARALPVAAAMTGRAGGVAEAAASTVGAVQSAASKVAASPVGRFIPSSAATGAVGSAAIMQGDSVGEEVYKALTQTPVATEQWAASDPGFAPVYEKLLETPVEKVRNDPFFIQQLESQAELSNLAPDAEEAAKAAWAANEAKRIRAADIANSVARKAAGISIFTNALPGGSAIETSLLRGPAAQQASRGMLERVALAATREGLISEPLEEGGGAYVGAQGKRQGGLIADPMMEAAAAAGQAVAPSMIAGGGAAAISRPSIPTRVQQPDALGRVEPTLGDTAPGTPGGRVEPTMSFTPAGSPTQQAGLVDIVVPLPGAATDPILGDVNVGTSGAPGGLAGAGGIGGGGLVGGSMGVPGPGLDGAAGGGGGVAGVPASNDGSLGAAGGATQQSPARLNRPFDRATDANLLARAEQAAGLPPAPAAAGTPAKIWAGRAGDGYTQPQDAQQALSGLQRKYPDLTWNLQQNADGKYVWAGTTRGDASGTAVTGAAGQGLAGQPGSGAAQQPGAAGAGVVGVGQAVSGQPGQPGGAATVGGTAANEPAFTLKLAPSAPLRAAGQAITMLKSQRGVDVEIQAGNLTDQQKVASAMARLVGKTVTYLNFVGGNQQEMPNGFVINGQDKNIYLDSRSDDGALFVMMHEGVHALPQPIREKLVTTIKGLTKTEMRGDFAQKFGYDLNNETEVDNEIAAFMTQAVTKRQDFWQELRTKMGDGDFAEVAKVILDKLNTFITGAKSQYGDEFLQRYATDAVAVRDAVSTAYADAMKAQGQPVPADVTGQAVTASNRAADVNPLGMYSELSRKLDAGPNQAPVDQWKAYIKGLPQKGVKPDEIEWSGVNDFLELKRAAGQKVTKADVAEYLKQGGVRVEETVLGNRGSWTAEDSARLDELEDRRYDLTPEEETERTELIRREIAATRDGESTPQTLPQYSQYTLPGGENYREVLLRLPGVDAKTQRLLDQERYLVLSPEDQAKVDAAKKKAGVLYRSSHWDQPNVLAHIRVNDRTDADGKRVLFVEELQSDWGQEGKKKGFADPKTDIKPVSRKEFDVYVDGLLDAYIEMEVAAGRDRQEAGRRGINMPFPQMAELLGRPEEYARMRAGRDLDMEGGDSRIPTAPFVTKTEGWLNLALKRVMIMAAEGGYDKVAFVNGEQSADRYDLSKQIETVTAAAQFDRDGNVSKYWIQANRKRDNARVMDAAHTAEELPDVIGKELAEKIVNDVTAASPLKRYSGLDLKVGGEGMKTFYDTIVPTALKKLLPKVGGGQVGNVRLPQRLTSQEQDSFFEKNGYMPDEESLTQPGFDVTDAMREKVATSGLPMFSNKLSDQAVESTTGRYTYTTDSKGRIIVKGDASRIRFLTRKLGLGIVTDEGIRFKADEAKAVLKALGEEPTVNPEIAKAIAKQLGLTPEELASTSLEYQTGQPKDRAFVAPLQGQIPETVQFLEQRRRSSGLPMLDISKPDDQVTLARLIAAETLAAIRASGNALQWYDETIARTLAMAAVKYPELGKNPNAQMVFRVAMAITSQGLNVENNLKFTMRQYDAFRKEGSFPEIGEGDSSQAMIKNFELVNALLREMGPNMLRRFLVTPFSVGELNAAGFSPEGELVDEQVLGSSVFGPKIGFGFYSNLNGNFEPVTMDMWFMRTIGRLTGYLRAFDPAKFSNQIKRFRDAFGQTGTDAIYADRFDPALVAQASTDQEAAIALARLVKKAHEKDYKDNRAAFDAGTRKKSELVLAADTMITSVDKPKDVPGNGTERRQLREVVRQAVAMVEGAYGQRVPPAAMQALIWYPEQELYKALGVKLSVTSQDYAGATEKVLKDEGYDEKRLRAAAESGSRGARRKARQDVQAGNQPAGSATGKTGPLEGAERDQFLRERYEASELAKERVEPKRKGIVFEVAPDPNNERLTGAWRTLTAEQRRDISDRVAREIVPRVLAQLDTDGIITSQVGSYLDDTNPSFTLLLNKGDVVKVAKALGFVLAQDSMMVVSPKEFDGGEKNSALVIEVGDKTPAQISAIYKKLRQIKVKGERPIGGQSYANGGMTILNYSSLPTSELAILVDQKLNKAYSILTRDVFAAFPEKKDYDYASEANDGRGSRAVLRQRARDLRAEASAALERELAGEGIQFSNRLGSDAAGGGRDRGVGAPELQESVTPSYGTPREGASAAVGYHYSKQPRTSLSSDMYGTGLRGAEMARLEGADPRLKQRVYFYVDRGTGINPEAGVGGQAHRVNLENLYDVDEDALRLRRDNNSFNDFESAVIDAGFDGYLTREAGPSGNAVLLGRHDVPVEQLGGRSRIQTGQPLPPARARELDDIEKISANKMLPAGQMSGKQWATLISRGMPEVYERLANSPAWQSDEVMYRGDLAKQLRASLPKPEFQRDPAVAKLFRDLESSRGLGRVRALEAVDAHPMGETIRQIDADFLDILQGLDDAGLVKINCK